MSAPSAWSLKGCVLVVGLLGDDGSGGARHESSHYHSVVSNGYSSSLKEKIRRFESAEE